MIYTASSTVRFGMVCLLGLAGFGRIHAGASTYPDLPAQVFAPENRAPLTKVEVFPAEIRLTTARDRQSIVVQSDVRRRHHSRRHQGSCNYPRRRQVAQASRRGLLSGR